MEWRNTEGVFVSLWIKSIANDTNVKIMSNAINIIRRVLSRLMLIIFMVIRAKMCNEFLKIQYFS